MISEEKLKNLLGAVTVHGIERTLDKMNVLREVKLIDEKAEITIAVAGLDEQIKIILKAAIKNTATTLGGIKEVEVKHIDVKPPEINKIDNVIAIMSGKGGVGKSLISGLSAIALRRQGFEVGILDADITGPSIPKMFGLTDRPFSSESGMLPVMSGSGIEVMSINLLLPSEDDAVIWRGPLIASAINQFWEEVVWGKLDYLIIDLPPGTADAPLTVLQKLPISGVIIVFSPQDLTAMVVRKAVNMAKHMNKKIIGVVENMSYLYVPELDKKIDIFGKSKAKEMAATAGAPLLAQFPIDPELAKLCDKGKIENYNGPVYKSFIQNINQAIVKA